MTSPVSACGSPTAAPVLAATVLVLADVTPGEPNVRGGRVIGGEVKVNVIDGSGGRPMLIDGIVALEDAALVV